MQENMKDEKMNFEFVFLGQSVLIYQVPLEVFVGLNELYETQKKHLPSATTQLAGKIPDEVSLFFAGPNTEKMHTHSYVSDDILKVLSTPQIGHRTSEISELIDYLVKGIQKVLYTKNHIYYVYNFYCLILISF